MSVIVFIFPAVSCANRVVGLLIVVDSNVRGSTKSVIFKNKTGT